MFLLPIAWLIGGFIGLASSGQGISIAPVISFPLLGGLVATDAKLSLRATTVIAALVGLQHGYCDGATMGQTEVGIWALLGVVLMVFVLVGFMRSLRDQTAVARIAVRVVGSWIVASGLLLLAWNLRGRL